MEAIQLWKIQNDRPQAIERAILNYESRLEEWIVCDISIISNDLLFIGKQIPTDFGKIIDILAMNQNGELVIIELKKDKTYRETVVQGIDYATWVKGLNYDDINSILLKNVPHAGELTEYFYENFNTLNSEIDEFNTDHKILIVGSSIDESTRRVIEYLSNEPYYVNINAVTFNYYKDGEQEFLARSFLLPESSVTEESKSKRKKKSESIVKVLFRNEKLSIGQRVIFKPAKDKGFTDESQYVAKIVNTNRDCLKREKDSECYSFSKLRKIIAQELNLTDVRENWGFGVKHEWITEDGKSLVDLRNEIEPKSAANF